MTERPVPQHCGGTDSWLPHTCTHTCTWLSVLQSKTPEWQETDGESGRVTLTFLWPSPADRQTYIIHTWIHKHTYRALMLKWNQQAMSLKQTPPWWFTKQLRFLHPYHMITMYEQMLTGLKREKFLIVTDRKVDFKGRKISQAVVAHNFHELSDPYVPTVLSWAW